MRRERWSKHAAELYLGKVSTKEDQEIRENTTSLAEETAEFRMIDTELA